ncbi:hypothetical protein SHV42_09910 [Pseudomonas capeferrum]|jgi:hypothetical protein|uniref:hypothetical protein n=1 Tax=Pseudomonas capeferrum TaxID=1495066 RepID=UPI003977F96F
MQKFLLNVLYQGNNYAGYDFDNLPLPVALVAAQQQIEQEADRARSAVMGDPLRAVEYQLAEDEASAFQAAGFAGDAPLTVQAVVDAEGIEPQQAVQNILLEAQAWRTALYAIRTARLVGKQAVLKATSHAEAEASADTAINAIRASVAAVA